MKTKILMLSIAVALPTAWAADNAEGPPRDGDRPRGERPPMFGPMPLLQPLDTDDDGIISADEIKNAPDSLKKLDKNGDDQISREEWQPQPPPRGDGERPRGGPRDGERPRGVRPRDGEAKAPEKKPDAPFGKEKGNADGEKPAGDQRGRPQGPPPPLVAALDTDSDGVLSSDEIGKSPESLAKLDNNKDGQLGPREYGPRPPQGGDRDKPQPKPES